MDKRVARGQASKAKLKEAFLELVQTEEPGDITVVELCEKTGLNRSTFYAHYEYMGQLIREVLMESIGRVIDDPTSLAPHERLTDLAVVPRERPHPGAAAREQPRDSPVIES